MNYFISAIGTDSGKTVISSILVEALKADYWKPVQAGLPTDSGLLANLVSNSTTKIHPEQFSLSKASSPHDAAKVDGVEIGVADFKIPLTDNRLIIEGAGGLLVPLNDRETILDLIAYLDIPLILVANLYLGSINHTLLSCEILKQKRIPVKGIIFNGPENRESMDVIRKMGGYDILYHLPYIEEINADKILLEAEKLKTQVSHL